MFERHPVLTIFVLFAAVMLFGVLGIWLWLSVGLIWASVLIVLALIGIPWLFQHRPAFLRSHPPGQA